MDKAKLGSMAVKKNSKMEKVVTFKMDERTYLKLKSHDVDVAKTVRNWLEAYAENLK